jgi:pimeloyl-ACP methyl ester carboxylesterase
MLRFQRPSKRRLFHEEEERRREARKKANEEWEKNEHSKENPEKRDSSITDEQFIPTEGGPDKLICDVGYYARRVGLDSETFLVQTEDGFIIELWHIYNPLTSTRRSSMDRQPHSPDIFVDQTDTLPSELKNSKYPVLLIHGLLQSSGAYCCTDDNSLAFYLAKSGLDVWLGNNRCGFTPRHTLMDPTDPRMWAWNIRQMGVMDLPALISRVLSETGFSKLALVAHSQGTTQTLVALAKEQRPEIGKKISVVCLLAPAAYAGPLIGKMYFKFMRVISPAMFRCFSGIHAFIPFMMDMHRLLPANFYGFMGYRVFSFLFNWSDSRWERDLRNRCFQFAPVYVSAESMRWWLGRECFARQKCILSTKREMRMENKEDEEEDNDAESDAELLNSGRRGRDRGRFAWYDEQAPPFALWIAGSDDLVDGQRLLRRFERGREPHGEIVHQKVIEGYEHLDVIWAIDSIEQVGKEVLETIWKTLPEMYRHGECRIPVGCEEVEFWNSSKKE